MDFDAIVIITKTLQDYRKLYESFIDTQERGIEYSIAASKHRLFRQSYSWMQFINMPRNNSRKEKIIKGIP